MVNVIYVVVGVFLLFFSGDFLIRGSVTIANRLHVSNFFISAVVIGFGTSMPEFLVSLNAVLGGFPEIALGNVIGSNISNVLLVLGIAATIRPISCKSSHIIRDAVIGMAAALVLALLSLTGTINRFAGLAMISSLIVYLTFMVYSEVQQRTLAKKVEKEIEKKIEKKILIKQSSLTNAILITIGSLILLLIGSHYLVKGAVEIAIHFGVSQAVIGLTLVAVGTSLPELSTACVAAWRNHSDIVVGNILGSNLFNILAILGIVSLIKPIAFVGQIANQDVWVMLAVMCMLIMVVITGKRISRMEGMLFLFLYIAYITWLYQ